MLRHTLLMSAVALCLAGQAPAQERTVRRVETATTGAQIHKLSVVMKSKVLIREDEPAGQIVDVVLSDGGCVEYFIASHDDQYYALPYQAVDVRYTDSVVFVDIAPARFKQIQFFTQDRWPDFASAQFREQVNSTFNVRVEDRGVRGGAAPRPAGDRPRDAGNRDRDDNRTDRNRDDSNQPDRNRNQPRDNDDRAPGQERDGARPRDPARDNAPMPRTETPSTDRDAANPRTPREPAAPRDAAENRPKTPATPAEPRTPSRPKTPAEPKEPVTPPAPPTPPRP